MGFGNGPRIVTDGLVLSLDAGDRNSYPGSGTTWNDLTGNGNDGTLVNGLTFNSSYNGGIEQDGSDDYITVPYKPSLAFPGNTPFSFQIVFRNKSLKTNFNAIISFGEQDTGNIGGFQMKCFYDSRYTGPFGAIGIDRYSGVNGFLSGVGYNYSTSIESLSTSIFTYTYDSVSGAKGYRNGVLFQSTPSTGSAATPASGPFTIGTRAGVPSRVTNAIINSFFMYNRTLTDAEVLQNYNATKTRFGL
jgi:hypothetical protein